MTSRSFFGRTRERLPRVSSFGHAHAILIRLAELIWWVRGGAICLSVLVFAHGALGFPSSRLVYVRGPGAEDCPDRDSVRQAVKERLGYDPFFPSSDKTIILRVVRDASKLRGEVELVDEHGTQAGKREFSAEQDQCDQLIRAMALSISIAIDPKSAETYAQGPADVPASDPPEKQTDPLSKPSTEPITRLTPSASSTATRPTPPESSFSEVRLWSAGLGTTAQFGSLPRVAFGASVFAAVRRRAWSFTVEGELDAPVTTIEQGVELQSSSFALKAVPCWHWRWASVCQVTAVRWLSATGIASNSGGTRGWLALGARVGAELPIAPWLSGAAYGDLLVTAVPVRLHSEGHELWRTPVLAGGLTLAAVVHFR